MRNGVLIVHPIAMQYALVTSAALSHGCPVVAMCEPPKPDIAKLVESFNTLKPIAWEEFVPKQKVKNKKRLKSQKWKF